jgi:AraC-like DNA-binding protein
MMTDSPAAYTLVDPRTGELALKISWFARDDSAFRAVGRYPYFSMLLVTGGSGTVVRDDRSYTFSGGCLLCFALYQPFAVMAEGGWEGVLINFHPGFFCLFKHRNEVSCNGVLFNNLYDTPVVELSSGEMQSLSMVAEQMGTELRDREHPDKDVLLSYLRIFLINASRAKMEQRRLAEERVAEMEPGGLAEGRPVKMPVSLERLQQAIETQFATLRSPGEYAELLHISPRALNKACKTYFHKTVGELIAERVIIEAKRELYLTARSVKEIAFGLGYEDEFYFSRYFKKKIGVSPQMFRDTVGFDKMGA